MSDKNLINEIDETYRECFSAQKEMLDEFEEDDGFYLGGRKQWNANDIAVMMDEKRTIISKNRVAKPINLITGYFRQNKMDIKYRPVEGNDQETADIYTELAKWAMENTGGRENIAYTFGDCARVGLGWTEVKMKYTDDPLYGDISINLCNKYNIMFDPYTVDPTLSDCDYILRYGYPSKQSAIAAYSKHEKDIENFKSNYRNKFLVQNYSHIQDAGTRINIVEKWYRVYEKKLLIIDVMTLDSYEWTSGKRKFNQLMEFKPELQNRLALIESKVPRIKLMAQAEDTILLYDDYAPNGFSQTMYPFIPMFCYYVPNFNDWAYKVKGIVRDLKDPQRELNKMNAIYMDAALTVPLSGWVFDTNTVKNADELDKVGAAQKIEVRPGKGLNDGLWQIQPPQMNPVLSQLYESYRGDMVEIGPNADLLGMIGGEAGASSSDASGLALQVRSKQGLMSLQNPFDGAALAHRMIGKYVMELINRWPREKIQKILGRQVPQRFDKARMTTKFDCITDTQSSSPTYQLAVLAQLQAWVQHGIQIPPAVLREAATIPARIKQLWMQQEQQQIQQGLKQRKEEQQLRIMEIQASQQGLIKSKQIEMDGRKEIEKLDQKGDEKIQEMKSLTDIAVERLKGESA